MKLRSTLLFAAASLTAPALLPVAATSAFFVAATAPAQASITVDASGNVSFSGTPTSESTAPSTTEDSRTEVSSDTIYTSLTAGSTYYLNLSSDAGVQFGSSAGDNQENTHLNISGTGDVWISNGRFGTGTFTNTGKIYVAGGQLFVSGTYSQNFYLGTSNWSEGNAFGNAALRVSGDTTLSGTTTILSGGSKVGLSGNSLTFSKLAGSGTLTVSNNNGTGTLTISDSSTFTGNITFGGNSGGASVVFAGDTTNAKTHKIATLSTSSSGDNRSITVQEGATVTATSLSNSWGISTLTVNGELNVGSLYYSSGAVNNTISGTGTINAETFTAANDGTYVVDGGVTLNIGSGGIATVSANQWNYTLTLKNALIGASADWTAVALKQGIALGATGDSATTFNTNGHTITLNSVLTGGGNLKKTGDGTLSIAAGATLGTVSVDAGTLSIAAGATLGAVSVDAGTLSLGGTINLSSAITVSDTGAVSVNATGDNVVVFNLIDSLKTSSDSTGTSIYYTLVSGANSVTNWDSLTKSNFTLNGMAISGRSTVDVTSPGIVKIDVVKLVWAGGETGTWNTSEQNWTNTSTSATDRFYATDDVAFETAGATITLGEAISAGTVSINENTSITATSTNTLSAATISVASGKTLTLSSGDYVSWSNLSLADSSSTVDLGSVNNTNNFSLSNVSGSGTIKATNTNTSSHGHGAINPGTGFTGTLDWTGNLYWNNLTLASGATLKLSQNSGESAASGTSLWGNSAGTISVNVTLGSDYRIRLESANLTLSGKLSADSDKTLAVTGGNTLYITGTSNDFKGTLSIGSSSSGSTVRLGATGDTGSAANLGDGAKVVVENTGKFWTNFGGGSGSDGLASSYNSTALSNDVYLKSGSTLGNWDGHIQVSGYIYFGVDSVGDSSSSTTYSDSATTTLTQYWAKTIDFTGTLYGAGTVTLQNPSAESHAYYKISGDNSNGFSGTYYVNSATANKTATLILANENAATNAKIQLGTGSGTSRLWLATNAATIAGLSGGGQLGLLSGTTASTLTINDAADATFSGTISAGISLKKTGTGTLTLSGANSNFNGSVTVGAGTLVVGAANALGTNNAGASVTLNGGTLKTADSVSVTFGEEKSLIASAASTLDGSFTLNGGTLSFTQNSATITLTSGSSLTLTSGTLDLSAIVFTTDNSSITLFSGAADADALKTSLEKFTLVSGDTKGTFSVSSSGTDVVFTASTLALVWNNNATEKTWTKTSFSGQTYSDGRTKTFSFGNAAGTARTATISEGVSAGKIVVDAGENGSYEFVTSENLTVGTVEIRSGSLTVNNLGDGTPLGTVSVSDGATLTLASDNTGFDSITLADGGTLVIGSTTAFANANNAATGGAILGSGTIVIDVGTGTLAIDNLAGALSNGQSTSTGSKFTGSIDVKTGTFNVSGGYNGKFKSVSEFVVENGARIMASHKDVSQSLSTSNALKIAGAGSTTATAGSAEAAAVAFTLTSEIASNTTLTGAATIYVAESVTGTMSGTISGADYTLTKTGAGTLTLSGSSVTLGSLNVSAGTVTLKNTAADSGARKNFSAVSLASGTTLQLFSGGYGNNAEKTAVGALALGGDATLAQTNHGGYWHVKTLSLASDVSSATLTLSAGHSSSVAAIYELGDASSDAGNFSGKILLNQTASGTNSHAAIVLSSENVAKDAVISFGTSSASDTNTSLLLGVNADTVRVAGLESNSAKASRTFVFSGHLAVNTNKQTEFDSSWIQDGDTTRTLVIDTAAETATTYYGAIFDKVNLVKSGAGTQTLAGASASFDGSVAVNEGTLKLTTENALGSGDGVSAGTAGAITVASGATLEIAISGDTTFANKVTGAGALKYSGTDVATLTGVGDSADLELVAVNAATDSATASTIAFSSAVSVGSISGAGIFKSATADTAQTLTLNATAANAFSGTVSNLDISVAGTGALNVTEKATFGGKISLDGGSIAGTLKTTSKTTLTANVSGATKIENLTLAGGTVEFTKLHANGVPDAKQWYSVGTLDFSGTENSVVKILLADNLTPKTSAGGEVKFTLFEFSTLQKNGTEISSETISGKKDQELLDALGGNIEVDYKKKATDFTGLTLAYEAGTDGKSKLVVYATEKAATLIWKGNTDGNGGWTEENVWLDGTTEKTWKELDAAELKDYKDSLTRTISVSGKIQPSEVIVSGGKYVIKLAGDALDGSGLAGSMPLTVKSGAELSMNLANTFTGGTTIDDGGTLNYGATGALGTGAVSVGGALNITASDETELSNAISGAGTISYIADGTATLSGDRSEFTGTISIGDGTNVSTLVLDKGTGTENAAISIAENSTLKAETGAATTETGTWGTYSLAKLTFAKTGDAVSGAGTIVVSSPATGAVTVVDLGADSTFSGTLELNAVDLAMVTAGDDWSAVSASSLAKTTTVRLTNGASLNFFNVATGFSKNLEVADTNGALRVYEKNTGVEISGTVSGAGTLTVQDGGVANFTGTISGLGGLTAIDSANVTITTNAADATNTITGAVAFGSGTFTINGDGALTIGGKLTTAGTTAIDTGTLTLTGGISSSAVSTTIVAAKSFTIGDGTSTTKTDVVTVTNSDVASEFSLNGSGDVYGNVNASVNQTTFAGTIRITGSVAKYGNADSAAGILIGEGSKVTVVGNIGSYTDDSGKQVANVSDSSETAGTLTLGENSTLTAGSISNSNQLTVSLGENSTLTAETLALNSIGGKKTSTLTLADMATANIGTISLNSNVALTIAGGTVLLGDGGIEVADGGSGNSLTLTSSTTTTDADGATTTTTKNLTLGLREGTTSWSSAADLAISLGGGTLTFDAGDSGTITIGGTISEATTETTSNINKTGAGTLVFNNVNTNTGTTTVSAGTLEYSLANATNTAFVDGATVSVADGATLKFSSSASVSGGTFEFKSGSSLVVGGAVTMTDATLTGDITYSKESGRNNALTLSGETSFGTEDSTITVKNATLNVEENAVVNAKAVVLDSSSASAVISGDGTINLAANSTISKTGNRTAEISVGNIVLNGNTTIDSETALTISSEYITVADGVTTATITKTGAGKLTFGENSLVDFTGSFNLEKGEVETPGTLYIVDGNSFTAAEKTKFTGSLNVSGAAGAVSTATIGSGVSFSGDLTVDAYSNLVLGGTLSGIGTFDLSSGNVKISLTDSFKQSLSGTTTLISFNEGLLDGAEMTTTSDFSGIIDAEIAKSFIGRAAVITYVSGESGSNSIQIAVTGALRWDVANFSTVDWVEDDSTSAKWLLVTANGAAATADSYFHSGDFLEFVSSENEVVSGTLQIARGTTVHTAGMVFNCNSAWNNSLTISALGSIDDGVATFTTSDDGDEGITINAGAVTISAGVVNGLKGGIFINGGSLTVAEGDALGTASIKTTDENGNEVAVVGDVFIGSTENATAATLAFSADAEIAQKIVIGNGEAKIGVADEKTVTLSEALRRADGASTSGLHKINGGTLKIYRSSDLDSVVVEGGTLAYQGTEAISGLAATVNSGATLDFSSAIIDNDTGEETAFGAMNLAGTFNFKSGTKYGTFRANTITGSGSGGKIVGDLYVGDSTSFGEISVDNTTFNADTTLTGTAFVTASGTTLTVVGDIAEVSDAPGTLYKYGAGTLSLTGKPVDATSSAKNAAFNLAADFVQVSGTVEFTSGANVSGAYSVSDDTTGTKIIKIGQTNTETTASVFTGGFSASSPVAFVLSASAQSLSFSNENGAAFNANGGDVAFLANVSSAKQNEFTITETKDNAVSFGDLTIGGTLTGVSDRYGKVHLTVDAPDFSAGIITISDGSTLALSDTITSASATGIYVDESTSLTKVVSTLELNGQTLTLTGTDDGAVLGGTGTLTVKTGTLSVVGKNWVTSGTVNAPKIVLDGATLNFDVSEDNTTTEDVTLVYTNLGGISTGTNGGTVSKSGAGTLVIFDNTGSGALTFDGEISLNEGATELYATVADATLTVDENATLRFYGSGEIGSTGIDGLVSLAKTVSGSGTIEVGGVLNVTEIGKFSGTLVAGTSAGNGTGGNGTGTAGTIFVNDSALSDFDGLKIQSGGSIVGIGAKIKTIDVVGNGTIRGYSSTDTTTTVESVSASAGSTLTLDGDLSVGGVTFVEDENDDNNVAISANANVTLSGATSEVDTFTVGSDATLTVDAEGALGDGSAFVELNDGTMSFTAGGTYKLVLLTTSGSAATVSADGVAVTLDAGMSISVATTFAASDGGTLSLDYAADNSHTTFAPGADSTVSVDFGSATTSLSATLSGAGTFEKTGSGTLTISGDKGEVGSISVAAGTVSFASGATIALAAGGAGSLSVAEGATLSLNGNDLSGFTLSGEGTATISGDNSLAGMASANNVTLSSGTLTVSGDISDSTIAFSGDSAKLAMAGTASGTTLSGETITLVGTGTYKDTTTISDATKLVLEASSGETTGTVAAAFSGSLTKSGAGTWTVSDYTFGENTDDALTVSGGTLVWESAKIGAKGGEITLATAGTLRVNGLADDADTLSATIGGAGTLEISSTGEKTLALDVTAATGAASWDLVVSGESQVSIAGDGALPGSITVGDSNSATVLTLTGSATLGGEDALVVTKGATFKLAQAESSTTTPSFTQNAVTGSTQPQVSGTVEIDAGKFTQATNMGWAPAATLSVAENATFAVNVSKEKLTTANSATITGKGTLDFTATGTTSDGYKLGGNLTGFSGTTNIADGATVSLTGENSMFGESATVNVAGTLKITHSAGGELVNLTGDGNVVINSSKSNPTLFTYGEGNTANVSVASGGLELTTTQIDNYATETEKPGTISVGGSVVADYQEKVSGNGSVRTSGIAQGGFVKITNDYENSGVADAADALGSGWLSLGAKAGVIFSGSFYAAENFGTASTQTFVAKGANVSLRGSTSVTGNVFVAADSTLEVNAPIQSASTATASAISSLDANDDSTPGTGGNSISGKLTLNGELIIYVTDASVKKALLTTGSTTLGGVSEKTKITLDVSKLNTTLNDAGVVTVLTGVSNTTALSNLVTVKDSSGATYQVSRNSSGNLVLLNGSVSSAANVPSNMRSLYNTICGNESSTLYLDHIQTDIANGDALLKDLVALSPVSFGSLIEMQSGFASIENDLLRERLEQRRYERTFASDRTTNFKPFVNVFGEDRESSGDGSDSANYDVTHTGVAAGFDVAVSKNTIFGVSLAMDWAKANLADNAGKHEGDGARLGIYGMSVFENAFFGWGFSLGEMSFDTKRYSGFNGETLKGETDGNDANLSLLAGLGYSIAPEYGLDVSPYIGLDIGYATAKSFTEKGGSETALDVKKIDRLSVRGKIGATLNWRATEKWRFGLDLAVAHEFGDNEADIDAAFASGDLSGKEFSTTAYLSDETTIQVGPRVDYRINDVWSASAAYTFESDFGDMTSHTANIGLRARF